MIFTNKAVGTPVCTLFATSKQNPSNSSDADNRVDTQQVCTNRSAGDSLRIAAVNLQ